MAEEMNSEEITSAGDDVENIPRARDLLNSEEITWLKEELKLFYFGPIQKARLDDFLEVHSPIIGMTFGMNQGIRDHEALEHITDSRFIHTPSWVDVDTYQYSSKWPSYDEEDICEETLPAGFDAYSEVQRKRILNAPFAIRLSIRGHKAIAIPEKGRSGRIMYRRPSWLSFCDEVVPSLDTVIKAALERGDVDLGVHSRDDILRCLRSTSPPRKRDNSEAHAFDDGWPPYSSIDMGEVDSHQSDRNYAAATRTANDVRDRGAANHISSAHSMTPNSVWLDTTDRKPEIQRQELEHTVVEVRPGSIAVGGGGDALKVQLSNNLPQSLRSTAPTSGHGGSQARAIDEAVGHHSVDVDDVDPQQTGQSSAAATHGTNGIRDRGAANHIPLRRSIPQDLWKDTTDRIPGIQGQLLEHTVPESRPSSTVVGRGGDALIIQLINELRRSLHSTAPTRGGGSQARANDEAVGHHSINVDDVDPQQIGQSSAAATHRTNDVESDNPDQRILQSLAGGLVILCFEVLRDISKDSGCPDIIKVFLYAGLGTVLVIAFIGIKSTRMIKPAMRVAASASMAALTIAAVHQFSKKVYMKCIFGTLGVIATLVMAAVHR